MVSNTVAVSLKNGASECHGAESTGVKSEVTETVEDCKSPKEVTEWTGAGARFLGPVEITDEVY